MPAFYQGNVDGKKSGGEQPNQYCAPKTLGCDLLLDWPVADDEVGIDPDKNAAPGEYSRKRIAHHANLAADSASGTHGYFASAFATHSGANESRYRQNRKIQQIAATAAN